MMEPEPEASLDEPLDPKIANRPLEPGSGAPDLNAIMKRVREERGGNAKAGGDPDAAKADFFAAVRRNAKAAAAEAETNKKGTGSPKKGGSKIADLFKTQRRPLLMAATAILVVLAGLQLGRGYLGDGEQPAAGLTPLVAEHPAVGDVPAEPLTAEPIAADTAAATNATTATDTPAEAAAQETPASESALPETTETIVPNADALPEDSETASAPALPPGTDTASLPDVDAALPAPAHADAMAAPKAAVAAPIAVPENAGPLALREAAEAGDAKALFELGSRYADGRGVKADMKQAATWYEKSAELGFAPAQYRTGNLYEKALGVDRDIVKAKTWYQLSAEQGNASAMHNLAVLYAMGADGTTDNESATRWFKAAAELGVKDSQFNLGILAAKGVGMPQSLEESYKWFALAAKSGDRDAAAKRDEIANSLRPEQLEKARGEVDLWKAESVDPETNSVEIPESWQETPGTTAGIDMKKAIGNIQRILNKNGYDAGGADGVMGEKTKNAIIAFQKDNGMTATGQVDEKLVRALLARK